jgi:hypothetical protein
MSQRQLTVSSSSLVLSGAIDPPVLPKRAFQILSVPDMWRYLPRTGRRQYLATEQCRRRSCIFSSTESEVDIVYHIEDLPIKQHPSICTALLRQEDPLHSLHIPIYTRRSNIVVADR